MHLNCRVLRRRYTPVRIMEASLKDVSDRVNHAKDASWPRDPDHSFCESSKNRSAPFFVLLFPLAGNLLVQAKDVTDHFVNVNKLTP